LSQPANASQANLVGQHDEANEEAHTELLTQVEKTLRVMEERLSDEEAWSEPEEKEEVEQDVNVELGWLVESYAPEEEYGEEYGKGEEESDDEGFWDEVYEVWNTPTQCHNV
jgi:hypothetical protein